MVHYVRMKDASTLVGAWCDWNDVILSRRFVRFNGKYNLAMKLHVPLYNKQGELVADVM